MRQLTGAGEHPAGSMLAMHARSQKHKEAREENRTWLSTIIRDFPGASFPHRRGTNPDCIYGAQHFRVHDLRQHIRCRSMHPGMLGSGPFSKSSMWELVLAHLEPTI